MSKELESQIKRILLDELGIVEEDKLNITRDEIAVWDSLKHLEIILTLEEEYDIHLTSEEVAQIHSLDDIVKIVGSKI
ncbi:acyl carrier protein [Cytobacillus praedii]|uniref:acyl carrier protein n=1 Tax=Cytobacillus praedii TaxID=1742358 RepID=UPI002E20C9D7|nr:acyl carrier protein [Cytobacillus praedii]